MKKKILIFLFAFALLASGASYGLHAYYDRYAALEKYMVTSLNYEPGTANAIKHATAAGDMFTLLRKAMRDDTAEQAVVAFGIFNEYLEQVIYPNSRDTAREIMKDMHNNYAGIVAAKAAGRENFFPIIIAFADNRTLIVKDIYNPFFKGAVPQQDVVAYGTHWFDDHRADIDKRIEKKLARAKALGFAQPVQVTQILEARAAIE